MSPDSTDWHAIWTHSRCEQLVNDQLEAKGFEVFLPKALSWARHAGARRQQLRPLFPGYLFIHHQIDKFAHVEILKARGVVRVLGERWDALAPIPHAEISAIQRVVASALPVQAHAHLTEGDRVRILEGPLQGVEGLFVRSKPAKGLLVVSIHLLRRSVAVEVDAAAVEAIPC